MAKTHAPLDLFATGCQVAATMTLFGKWQDAEQYLVRKPAVSIETQSSIQPDRPSLLSASLGDNGVKRARASRITRWLGVAATALGCAFAPHTAQALKLIGDKCEYIKDELADPDKVMELYLAGERHCSFASRGGNFYGTVQLPHFGTWPRVHPERAIAQLLRRYGVPKNEPFEPTGEQYREFKILGKRSLDPIEGHAVVEYTVELLYVSLDGWMHVPGSGRFGIVPVCERNTLNVVAVEFDGSWYVDNPPGIGYSTAYALKGTSNRTWDKAHISRDLADRKRIADRCKDHLN